MPQQARAEAAKLSAQHRVPLLEDDPYSDLRIEGPPLPPIQAFDQAGTVVYIGSFSKVLAPAVRLGWVVAPRDLIARIRVLRESQDLESSTRIQRAVHRFVADGGVERHLRRVRSLLKERRDAMLDAREAYLAGAAQWTRPKGGLFIWLTLPTEIDTWKLFECAIAQQVAFIPCSAFSVGGGDRNTMRLSFGNVKPDPIKEGKGSYLRRRKMTEVATPESRPMTEEADFLQVRSMDHNHFWVGNAKHAMHYWWKAFGFEPVAYSGLETGNRRFASYVLESRRIRFVVSALYSPTDEMVLIICFMGMASKSWRSRSMTWSRPSG